MTSPQESIFQIIWPSFYESFLRNIKKKTLCTSNKIVQNPGIFLITLPLIRLWRSWCGKVTTASKKWCHYKDCSMWPFVYNSNVMKAHGYWFLLEWQFLYFRLEHRHDLVQVIWKFTAKQTSQRAVHGLRFSSPSFLLLLLFYRLMLLREL